MIHVSKFSGQTPNVSGTFQLKFSQCLSETWNSSSGGACCRQSSISMSPSNWLHLHFYKQPSQDHSHNWIWSFNEQISYWLPPLIDFCQNILADYFIFSSCMGEVLINKELQLIFIGEHIFIKVSKLLNSIFDYDITIIKLLEIGPIHI